MRRNCLPPPCRYAEPSELPVFAPKQKPELCDRNNPALAAGVELHDAGARGEDRVVAAGAGARLEAGAALADDDLPARHLLTREQLDAQALRDRVAPVPAGSETFLVS